VSSIAQILMDILELAPQVPGLIAQVEALYQALVGVLSDGDAATVQTALASAKSADAAATAAADAALAPPA
jgi:hypothetical protein